MVSLIQGIIAAGTDTTRNQLSTSLALLSTSARLWYALEGDDELVMGVVEESLRYSTRFALSFARSMSPRIPRRRLFKGHAAGLQPGRGESRRGATSRRRRLRPHRSGPRALDVFLGHSLSASGLPSRAPNSKRRY